MATKIGPVLDCADPAAPADFWSKALGYTTLGGAGSYLLLVDGTGVQPTLPLQGVLEEKAGKNPMHLDIEVGARRVAAEQMHEHGTRWVLMTDPDGTEFCVCDGGQDSEPSMRSGRCGGVELSGAFADADGAEARAQQVERVDGLGGVGKGVLFDDMPPVADPERRGPHPQPPRKMQSPADLADGGVEDLEVLSVTEPGRERSRDRVGAVPVRGPRREHRPEPDVAAERGRQLLVVAGGERLQEHPSDRPAGRGVRGRVRRG